MQGIMGNEVSKGIQMRMFEVFKLLTKETADSHFALLSLRPSLDSLCVIKQTFSLTMTLWKIEA